MNLIYTKQTDIKQQQQATSNLNKQPQQATSTSNLNKQPQQATSTSNKQQATSNKQQATTVMLAYNSHQLNNQHTCAVL